MAEEETRSLIKKKLETDEEMRQMKTQVIKVFQMQVNYALY